jgi:hypothetical protein
LRLKQIHGDCHTSSERRPILMKDQQVVDVENAPNTQPFQEPHQGPQQLRADARRLGHAKTDRLPLHPPARDGVPEAAVFALGRMKTHRQVTIGQVDQHAEVVALNAVRHGLQRVHFEGHFPLKLV